MKLSEYLKSKNMTGQQFADVVGCGQPMISLMTNGERRPSPELALRIEQVTNGAVTLRELLFPQGEPQESNESRDGNPNP